MARQASEAAVLCTVIATKGSTPRKVGAKMIVFRSGQIVGTIGGGNLEKKVIANALLQIAKNEPSVFKHDLLHQHNMCCGGSVDIFIEPISKMKRLYIFGAGHTGEALAKFATSLDFDIYLIDDRKEYLDRIKINGVNKMHVDHREVLSTLPFNENTFITIMTYEHGHDRDILAHCIKQPFAYLGMIGSKRKVEVTKKMFVDGGIATTQELEKVDMPMGIDIGAEGPEEIAVSILAKVIEMSKVS